MKNTPPTNKAEQAKKPAKQEDKNPTKIIRRRRFTPPPAEAYSNKQLNLFQGFLANSADQRDTLSNAIDFWDGIPRYAISRARMNKLRTPDGLLKPLKIPFNYRGRQFIIQIQAAIIETEHGWVAYYPSAREELIEHALRKIALEQYAGFFDRVSYESGVHFSLWRLRQELGAQGHQLRYDEIKEGLDILALSSIKITPVEKDHEKNSGLAETSPYLPALVSVTRSEYDSDRTKRWGAKFHPLVTGSIDKVTYRQYNYWKLMQSSSQLARWLLLQLVLKYTQAALATQFEMRYSTIKRDSALLEGYNKQTRAIQSLDEAWDELKEQGTLMNVKKTTQVGPRGKIEDVLYTLTPSREFVAEQKAANRRSSDARAQILE